ncbi:TetR/AcrR family transcriptional regulator [Liquorilactobacillus satsumensis]|uniref:Transcriptional regulator n=1 Tax=Liquorilactobacillus satsumensis DSM 16230 = JCM 12392 TaxID=1423801 RepID=A0A0R1V059_9LACO|nr:TetR/AcrR family transcriptional regulator [Liquorilactobacillus satsumensis]KRL98993.1 transcriptional regulator [Liquorilactobacillus satsumensis DSM 16230 = JCM 12392]MCP9328754.1 TetR/AcrR family transcriptional regulator [Liquorilactobacillus satsumensis]
MNGQARLAAQSRKWLLEALFKLLKQRDYSAITVKDIAETAQLSRRTFYRAFKNKDELLKYYGEHVMQRYLAALQQHEDINLTFEQVLRVFFNFWWQERQQIKLLIQQNLFISLLPTIVPQSFHLYELFDAPWHIQGTPQEINYIMSFSVAGFWNILNTWLAKEDPEEPAEMVKILLKAIHKLKS